MTTEYDNIGGLACRPAPDEQGYYCKVGNTGEEVRVTDMSSSDVFATNIRDNTVDITFEQKLDCEHTGTYLRCK